ncbi:MAG: DNA repair protein RadA [Gammaproteobacteria bacterium]|nr:DNA repair protein RadA [Gammaproteobacteria bacterium]
MKSAGSKGNTQGARRKTVFNCTECGSQAPKWAGQCGDCGAWNTLIEDVITTSSGGKIPPRYSGYAGESAVCNITDVKAIKASRISTGFSELDRVLGGGLVNGSAVLIGGDPGIGKSTLLIQAIAALSQRVGTLYVTGEESLQQVSMRAHRLGLTTDKVRLLSETQVQRILALADKEKPGVLVIDSIQTVYTDQLNSAPGSVSQVRESAAHLVQYAKQTGTAIFLVGHVTKEGALAGPRVLEHMVDTVLYFEGDSSSRYRVIRAVKNRFGAVNEVGVFDMSEKGLREVTNPSAIFVSRHEKPVSGSVIMVTREGTRPMLVEVQALVTESHLPNPRRVTVGLDQNRLAMLLAVLQRHGGIAMYDQDVFVNIVGGVRVSETAADLAVILSALSSMRDKPLPTDLAVFGEIGLAGEIRPVQNGQERIKEAVQHGYKRVIVPLANKPAQPIKGLEVIAVQRLVEAIEQL